MMFNKDVRANLSAVKLIDKAIVPLVIVVAARYLGIFLYGFLPSSSFTFGQGEALVPFVRLSETVVLSANTFSWAFVALVLGFYFGFLAFRNLHLNQDSIYPLQSWFFHNKKLEFLIVETKEATHQNTTLLLISVFSVFFIAKDFFSGILSPVVFGLLVAEISILILFFSQYLFLSKDLEREQIQEEDYQNDPQQYGNEQRSI